MKIAAKLAAALQRHRDAAYLHFGVQPVLVKPAIDLARAAEYAAEYDGAAQDLVRVIQEIVRDTIRTDLAATRGGTPASAAVALVH